MLAPEINLNASEVAFTTSVISHNLFDEIVHGRGSMAAHELIVRLALDFETEHCNVEEIGWEEFLEDKDASDWEEYLIEYVKQKL